MSKHREGKLELSEKRFFQTLLSVGMRLIPGLALVLVLFSHYLIFVVVPNEKIMGAVQRIFYFHVGSAIAAYLMIAIVFIGSVFYLITRKWQWDIVAEAGASVALVFCTAVLLSGMIWGHSAWNIWWRWEPRLVSFLVLWLILFSYVVLRALTAESSKKSNYAAVLGIISAVNVPIVILSIKLISHTEQLHPQIVGRPGGLEPIMMITLMLSIAAVVVMSLWLLMLKHENLKLNKEKELLARELPR